MTSWVPAALLIGRLCGDALGNPLRSNSGAARALPALPCEEQREAVDAVSIRSRADGASPRPTDGRTAADVRVYTLCCRAVTPNLHERQKPPLALRRAGFRQQRNK